MKILCVNTFDIYSGAARAAFRLHQGLRQINIDSKMLVQDKKSDYSHIICPDSKLKKVWNKLWPHLDRLPLQLYRKRQKTPYHIQWLPGPPLKNISHFNPDIIHLHWICGGFVSIEFLAKVGRPIVWTLHDSWAFTGGCHIPYECKKYKNKCGKCPVLGSCREWDFSRWVWHRKHKAWLNLNLTIVAPSRWLAECAKESSLFQSKKIKVIPNGMDLKRYKPMNQALARQVMGLPNNKKLVLFGAMRATSDPNKGFSYLQSALHKLKKKLFAKEIEIVVFGSSKPENVPDFAFPVYYTGRLHDDISLAVLYSAADVMVVPSKQEAFGQTASEAMACGTPVVAFDTTGLKDIVDHKKNGYLARPFDIEDLAHGIGWVLSDSERHHALALAAREKVEREFEIELVARQYLGLYKKLVSSN